MGVARQSTRPVSPGKMARAGRGGGYHPAPGESRHHVSGTAVRTAALLLVTALVFAAWYRLAGTWRDGAPG